MVSIRQGFRIHLHELDTPWTMTYRADLCVSKGRLERKVQLQWRDDLTLLYDPKYAISFVYKVGGTVDVQPPGLWPPRALTTSALLAAPALPMRPCFRPTSLGQYECRGPSSPFKGQ